MYKRIKGKKFGRETDQRKAFMRSLASNLIMQEKIKTTKVRARQAASLVEKMITKAKKNDLASKKMLVGALPKEACIKLAASIAARFAGRNGGYTRVISLGQRAKDGAEMAIVELLDRPVAAIVPAKEAKGKKKLVKKEKKTVKKAAKAKEEIKS